MGNKFEDLVSNMTALVLSRESVLAKELNQIERKITIDLRTILRDFGHLPIMINSNDGEKLIKGITVTEHEIILFEED